MTEAASISAIIPTRDRPADLERAVASILGQDRLPEELIIVDQSEGSESREVVESLFAAGTGVELRYIHDPRVTGLVDAKRVGAGSARGSIVCFLEDDIVLEPSYIGEIERGFALVPDMVGCSGVITNQPHGSLAYELLHRVFFRGIFRDPRVGIFRWTGESDMTLVRCDVLSGGLSAWRREVFEVVPFDVANGFHMLEDMEFSTRAVRRFGSHLYVNRAARLQHFPSPVNRDAQGRRQRRKLKEAVLFFRKRRGWPGARRGLALVLVWWWGEALLQSIRRASIGPVVGYARGLGDGISWTLVADRERLEA